MVQQARKGFQSHRQRINLIDFPKYISCKVRSIEKDTKVYAKYQVVKHSEIILFFYLHITLLSGS